MKDVEPDFKEAFTEHFGRIFQGAPPEIRRKTSYKQLARGESVGAGTLRQLLLKIKAPWAEAVECQLLHGEAELIGKLYEPSFEERERFSKLAGADVALLHDLAFRLGTEVIKPGLILNQLFRSRLTSVKILETAQMTGSTYYYQLAHAGISRTLFFDLVKATGFKGQDEESLARLLWILGFEGGVEIPKEGDWDRFNPIQHPRLLGVLVFAATRPWVLNLLFSKSGAHKTSKISQDASQVPR